MTNRPTYYQMLVSPKIGGAAKVALSLGDYVRRIGAGDSRILVPDGGMATQLVQDLGFWSRNYDLDRLMKGSRISLGIESLLLLHKTAFSAGLIHFHSPAVFGATRAFRMLSRLKSVVHIHLNLRAEDLRWAFREPPDLIILCAGFMRSAVMDSLRDIRSVQPRVSVIRNAVDVSRFSLGDKRAAKRNIGADERTPLAMIVANLAPHKGQMTCIRAIAKLKKRGCQAQLWVVGESREAGSTYEGELRAACTELGVSDLVSFTGFRTDTEDLYRAADFVLLPSTSEGLPLSILEAQASGAIVLAAPTAGIPEVVFDGETGYLIAADDAEGYCDRLERLIKEELRIIELRAAARRYIQKEHELDRYCERVVSEYKVLLGNT